MPRIRRWVRDRCNWLAGRTVNVGLGFLVRMVPPVRTVLGGAVGPALVPVLQQTGVGQLIWSVLVATPLVFTP